MTAEDTLEQQLAHWQKYLTTLVAIIETQDRLIQEQRELIETLKRSLP